MAKTMKAAVVRQFGKPLTIEDVPDREPGPGQIRLAIRASASATPTCMPRRATARSSPPLRSFPATRASLHLGRGHGRQARQGGRPGRRAAAPYRLRPLQTMPRRLEDALPRAEEYPATRSTVVSPVHPRPTEFRRPSFRRRSASWRSPRSLRRRHRLSEHFLALFLFFCLARLIYLAQLRVLLVVRPRQEDHRHVRRRPPRRRHPRDLVPGLARRAGGDGHPRAGALLPPALRRPVGLARRAPRRRRRLGRGSAASSPTATARSPPRPSSSSSTPDPSHRSEPNLSSAVTISVTRGHELRG